MEKKIKMSIEDFHEFVDDEDPELAIAKCCFLSTKENSHHLKFTKEVLKRDAKTILGKFLIGNMDFMNEDVLAHEENPLIFGYFPSNQNIEFVEEDDELLAFANAVVSKLYAKDFYDIFIKDNFRNTSVEMLTATNKDDENLVDAFNICGLTVLGKSVNGSCPDANMEMIRFSKDDADVFYDKYINNNLEVDKVRKEVDTKKMEELNVKKFVFDLESIWSVIWNILKERYPYTDEDGDTYGSVYNINGIFESEDLSKFVIVRNREGKLFKIDLIKENDTYFLGNELVEVEEKYVEITKASAFEVPENSKKYLEFESKEKDEDKDNDEDKEDKENSSDVVMNETEEVETKEDKNNEKKEEKLEDVETKDEEKMSKLSEKVEELEKELKIKNKELEQLRKFKSDIDESKKKEIVTSTLAKVKDYIDEDSYSKFEENSKSYKFEDITFWKNEVLASMADRILMAESNDDVMRMAIVQEPSPKKGLWD